MEALIASGLVAALVLLLVAGAVMSNATEPDVQYVCARCLERATVSPKDRPPRCRRCLRPMRELNRG